jgi:hypothetical protein
MRAGGGAACVVGKAVERVGWQEGVGGEGS